MREVEHFKWWLPNPNPRGRPYLSRWHMTKEDAEKRGAIAPEPHSRMVIMVPETPEERHQRMRETDTGANQKPPWWITDKRRP